MPHHDSLIMFYYAEVRIVDDAEGAELMGTLKNIVALGAGFIDGLGLGNNSKAAIIRIGMQEMIQAAKDLFPTAKESTILESCGVADLITTCYGGESVYMSHLHLFIRRCSFQVGTVSVLRLMLGVASLGSSSKPSYWGDRSYKES